MFIWRSANIIFFSFLLVQMLHAQDIESAHMNVVSDDLVGVALYPDGETPVRELPIRVWDADAGRMVLRTQTDDMGVFRVSSMNPGNYYLFVGMVKINMSIFKSESDMIHQRHDLLVVIPRGIMVSARPRMMDLLIAPLLLTPPEAPSIVSP